MDSVGPVNIPAGGVTAEVKQVLYHWWDDEEPAVGATHFGVTAQVFIGDASDDLADSFDLTLCSPSMFAERHSPERWGSELAEDVLPGGDVLPVAGVWLMKAWSPQAFETAVQRLLVASSPGPDFMTVANRIGRYMPWEYDYKYDSQVNRQADLPNPTRSFWHDD